MKDGFRVWDADTHVNPAAEVLERYVDPDFRPRLAELAPYRVARQAACTTTASAQNFTGGSSARRRRARPSPAATRTGAAASMPRPGVQDDQAENRVKDMDDEGTDVAFPDPGLLDQPRRARRTPRSRSAMIRAYHRHMADFCGQHPTRLKGLIVASTRDVDAAVREIREWGKSSWAVAVMPLLAKDMPGRPPRPRPDLARRRGARPADRAPQLDLEPALFPGLPRPVGQHLPRPPRLAPLGRDALHRRVHRRRHPRPLSRACAWASSNAASAGCRSGPGAWTSSPPMSAAPRRSKHEAQRIPDERAVLLQHRAPRGRGHVQPRHRSFSATTC